MRRTVMKLKGSFQSLLLGCLLVAGCATSRTQPPNVDVTGEWVGEWVNATGSGGISMTLKQVDGIVTGEVVVLPASLGMTGAAHGSVEGNILSIAYRGSGGNLTVRGDEMSGRSPMGSTLTLRRR